MKRHAFFFGGEIKLDAHVVLVILEGFPWKIVSWSLWGDGNEVSTPNLGKKITQVDYGAIFFSDGWEKNTHQTRFGLVSYNDEAIRIFWGEVACYLRLLQCRSWTFMVSTVFLDHQRRWCSKRRFCRWLIPLMTTRNPAFNSLTSWSKGSLNSSLFTVLAPSQVVVNRDFWTINL